MKNKYDYDLIIIGGGSGGLSLASGAGQLGVKTLLVDKEMFGGDCLHYGCVPSKALIKSGKVAHYLNNLDSYGLSSPLTKEGLGEVSWDATTKRIKSIQDHIQVHDSAERFESLGCDVLFGMARFTDPHTIEVKLNGSLEKETGIKTFSAKKITIATGSRPMIPNIEGLKETGFITNEDIFSLKAQPKKLAIIGGGVIATELAQAMQRLGSQVTIFERHAQFFGRFDADIAEVMTEKIRSEGIEVLTKAEPGKISKSGSQKIIKFNHKNTSKEAEFDEILIAAGRSPNTNLDLEAAGVEYSTRGIKVDTKLRTSQKHITAIGDVNGASMFTHTANYEAGLLVRNEVLGIPFGGNVDYAKIGWTIYTDPEVASIGIDENTAQKQKLKYEVIKFDLGKNDRALAESETTGFVKILINQKKKIIGAHIVAPRAGEMIREWQLAISKKMKLSDIAQSTYIYPTFGEASKWAASTYFGPKLFNSNVKKWLARVWGYRGR